MSGSNWRQETKRKQKMAFWVRSWLIALAGMALIATFEVPGAWAACDCTDTATTGVPQIECEALVAFYNSARGTSGILVYWNSDTAVDSWWGVTVSEGVVTELELNVTDLNGTLPPELGNLSSLATLQLGDNRLTGSIPPELGNLSKLTLLDLGINQLTGTIPKELGNLNNLEILGLYSNKLTGSIPPELGNLGKLTDLFISGNRLSGTIPPELGNLSNLTFLSGFSNRLTGPIPPELGELGNLTRLEFSFNQLTGIVPPELGNMENLEVLGLNRNALTGSIPPELGNLNNLQSLVLDSNQLAGEIPSSLTNLTSLWFADIGYNMLNASGAVATFFDTKDPDWTNTQTIPPTNLGTGALSPYSAEITWSPIPYTGDGGFYRVKYATAPGGPYTEAGTTVDKSASNYTVTGLDPEIAYYFVVETFTPAHLGQRNDLTSPLSAEISATTLPEPPPCDCTDEATTGVPQIECEALLALFNRTNGPEWTYSSYWNTATAVDGWYGVMVTGGQVTEIDLEGNNLSGPIPPELGNLSNLQSLDLASNRLTGSIPTELGNLSNAEQLWLNSNQLTGEIPSSLTNLTSLTSISIGENMLTASDAVATFLVTKDPLWSTQTIPPTNLSTSEITKTSVKVSWTPIPYTADGGYYRVKYASSPNGPYTAASVTTDKTASEFTVTGLRPGATYFFAVETFTPAHDCQQNDLTSPLSAPVSATTEALILPTVTTGAVGAITATTAQAGGTVEYNGEGIFLRTGICWNTSPAPQVSIHPRTDEGRDLGAFTSAATDLEPDTEYYLRAYAQIRYGAYTYTTYGETVQFRTLESATEPGDANGDGEVDLLDAILILQILAGDTAAAANATLDADVNNDGRLGLEDAIYILRVVSQTP